MIPLVVVLPVNDKELVGRIVSSRTEAKFCRSGDVPASVFSQPGNFEISVDRVDRMTPGEAIRHGELIASLRGTNRLFRGWALLRRPDMSHAGCGCRASPGFDNFWHADILMPQTAAGDNSLHGVFAAALARRSSWRGGPEG